MKTLLSFLLFILSVPVTAAEFEIASLPEINVLAVASPSESPEDYAAAYGRLVGFYAQPSRASQVVFPQMSLSINGKNYAAIAFQGTVEVAQGVEILPLPTCQFAHKTYIGNYPGIGPTIQSLMTESQKQGFSFSPKCGIRIFHINSPDNTAADKLIHEVYVPIIKGVR